MLQIAATIFLSAVVSDSCANVAEFESASINAVPARTVDL